MVRISINGRDFYTDGIVCKNPFQDPWPELREAFKTKDVTNHIATANFEFDLPHLHTTVTNEILRYLTRYAGNSKELYKWIPFFQSLYFNDEKPKKPTKIVSKKSGSGIIDAWYSLQEQHIRRQTIKMVTPVTAPRVQIIPSYVNSTETSSGTTTTSIWLDMINEGNIIVNENHSTQPPINGSDQTIW